MRTYGKVACWVMTMVSPKINWGGGGMPPDDLLADIAGHPRRWQHSVKPENLPNGRTQDFPRGVRNQGSGIEI